MSFVRVIRGFAEGSLAALVFAFAILVIGTPIALIIRGLDEGLSWLVRLGGEMSSRGEALVSVSSVTGGLVIALLVARLIVRSFYERRPFRARVITGRTPHTEVVRQEIGMAA
jgi:hypothetical protein